MELRPPRAPLGHAELLRLLEDSPDIVFSYRLRPRPGFTYVNRACTTITGYTPEEHYAEPRLLMMMVDPRDRERLRKISAGLAHADGTPYVLRWVRRDGKVIATEQRLFVERGTDGRPDGFQGIVREVTDHAEADEKLRLALATSQHLVDKLRRAIERARSLSGMIPICSHCKSVRNADGQWVRIDAYLAQETHARFTHGICSDCYGKLYPDGD